MHATHDEPPAAVQLSTGISRGEFTEFPRAVITYTDRVYSPYGGGLDAAEAIHLGSALTAAAWWSGHRPTNTTTATVDGDEVALSLPAPVSTPQDADPHWTHFPTATGFVSAHAARGVVAAGDVEVSFERAWIDGLALISAGHHLIDHAGETVTTTGVAA